MRSTLTAHGATQQTDPQSTMSAILAGPPGECCRKTIQHEGQPRGKVETIAGVESYVARPADGSRKKIILFFADVYGALYINAQLVMDYWADNGESSTAPCIWREG